MNQEKLGFIHKFIPGKEITFLLLHGTGGNEESMISIARSLNPNAAILSPRGKVLENGMNRFFRRFAEGVFDTQDLKFRTLELAEFVEKASSEYMFDIKKVIAVGYSNGANISASMLFLKPELLAGAVLFRAMFPFEPGSKPNLKGKPVFIAEGTQDPMVTKENAEKLISSLKEYFANVSVHWAKTGHSIANEDIIAAKKWLDKNFG